MARPKSRRSSTSGLSGAERSIQSPCVCRGTDPGCPYCGGSGRGRTSQQATEHRQDVLRRVRQASFDAQQIVKPVCRHCGQEVSNLTQHLRAAHPGASAFRSRSVGGKTATSVVCSVCGAAIRRDLLSRHIEETHRKKVFVAQRTLGPQITGGDESPTQSAPRLTLARCAKCDARFPPARMEDHLLRVHSPEAEEKAKAKAKIRRERNAKRRTERAEIRAAIALLVPKRPGAKGARCPECGVVTWRDQLAEHRKSVHGVIPRVRQLGGRPRKPALNAQSDRVSTHQAGRNIDVNDPRSMRESGDKSVTESTTDRWQDATRTYAHDFRDHGQFGSHPSHDRFDDESDA
jgi:hypothetical protein